MKFRKLFIFIIIIFSIIIPFILVLLLQNIFNIDKNLNNQINNNKNDLIAYKESKKINTGLSILTGVASDRAGNIYVTGDKKIFIITNDYHYIIKIDLEDNPLCITVNKNIYVGFKTHIEKFSLKGVREKIWSDLGGNALLTSIKSKDNDIYVCDAGNKVVMHYNEDGKLISIIEKKINGKKSGFNVKGNLFDVEITGDNNLLITESGNLAIHKYKPNGEFVETWGKSNDFNADFTGCCNPSYIARMSDGTIVAGEKGIVRIKLYEESGKFKSIAIPPSDFSNNVISGLSVDNKDRILILDPALKIVRVFTKKAVRNVNE